MTTGDAGVDASETFTLVTTPADLANVVQAARAAPLVAVDAEGNGLFAYRTRLCTVQLAWQGQGRTHIAVIDTLALDPSPLAGVLDRSGPMKVLHDLTFDVKLLAEAGVTLDNVRDTSVLARMLGRKATGLAALLSSELGIVVPKELQQHDWSRRPLRPLELAYLASDVRHLGALFDKLSGEAAALDIEEEVHVECAFKHQSALIPPREKRPAYLRIKGVDALDTPGLAVLRRLVMEREAMAELWDVPPFKVVSNETLLTLAQHKPASHEELKRIKRGISPRLAESSARLLAAVAAGLADGTVPASDLAAPARPDRAIVAARRAAEKRLTAWRRAEAAARGIDEQVVLPGHCLADLVALGAGEARAVEEIRGLGARRYARYGATLLTLLAGELPVPAPVGAEIEA
jgi:ribonuclease D